MMGDLQNERDLEDLLTETARGNREAFRSLYAAVSGKLFAVLIRILENEADASDVLQDVFITVWNRAERFDSLRGNAISWLVVIARNAGIDALRRRRPGQIGEAYCDQKTDDQPTPFDRVVKTDVSQELTERLHQLPAAQRIAVRLFYFEEQSLAEVASEMEAPINTVKSWVRRGVANLRNEFKGQEFQEFF